MTNGGKLFRDRTGDTLGGRVGRHQRRIASFDFQQPVQEFIIFKITDDRLIFYIVEIIVIVYFRPEFFKFLLYIFRQVHCAIIRFDERARVRKAAGRLEDGCSGV